MLKRLGTHLTGMLCALLLAAAPALAAKDTVVIDLSNETATCDPHMQWNQNSYGVYRNIFDNLITRDNAGVIIPSVATSWKYLNDTQVEFTIRTDITFHDGTSLTPEDVVYSITRITDKATASPQRSQFEAVVKAEVTGPDRVVFTTDKPYPPLLAQLVKLSIVPRAYVEKVGKELLMERRHKEAISTNIDFYSGFVYEMLGLPMELYTPLFATARVTGWCAHRIEEVLTGGRIMRPAYRAAVHHEHYVPIDQR